MGWTCRPEKRQLSVALTSLDKQENFTLDATRAQIKLTKATYQNRARQAINRPTRDSALLFINAWGDTRQVRPADSKAYAVLNDKESPVSGAVIDALRNYQIQPVPWSQRVACRVTHVASLPGSLRTGSRKRPNSNAHQ